MISNTHRKAFLICGKLNGLWTKNQQLSVCLGNNRKFGCVQARRNTADVISHSMQLDKKQKSISKSAGNQVKVEDRNLTLNPWTLHDEQSFNNIHLITNQFLYSLVTALADNFETSGSFDMMHYTHRNEFQIHGKLK